MLFFDEMVLEPFDVHHQIQLELSPLFKLCGESSKHKQSRFTINKSWWSKGIRCILWNGNGCSSQKMKWLIELTCTFHIDCISLTETHNNKNFFSLPGWKSFDSNNKTKPTTNGVRIICRIGIKISKIKQNSDGSTLSCLIEAYKISYYCLCLYAPSNSTEKTDWWEKNLRSFKNYQMILGDFNFVDIPERDRINSTNLGITNSLLNEFQNSTRHLNDCAELQPKPN